MRKPSLASGSASVTFSVLKRMLRLSSQGKCSFYKEKCVATHPTLLLVTLQSSMYDIQRALFPPGYRSLLRFASP